MVRLSSIAAAGTCVGLLAAGCQSDGDLQVAHPDIRLSQTAIDFGSVQLGTYHLVSIAVYNDGTGWLHLSDAMLGDGTPTTFQVQPPGREVAPGAWVELPVVYAPNHEGGDTGVILLTSDDPDAPEVPLYLSGSGVQPQVQVDPSLLYFATSVSGPQALDLHIASLGSGPLHIDGVGMEVADPAFSIELPPEVTFPYTLDPGLILTVSVGFAGDDGLAHADRIRVDSDDPDSADAPWYVDVVADGEPPWGTNHDPLVEILEPAEGALFAQGEPISFRGQVADADEAPDGLAILWQSDLDGYFGSGGPDPSGAVATEAADLSPGEHRVTLIARDTEGAEATDTIVIRVYDADDTFVYTVSGGATVWDFWHVDDDVSLFLNGAALLVDDDDHENTHAPFEFEARPGDVLRLVARDEKWCTKALSALTLHVEGGGSQSLNGEVLVSACDDHPDYDPAYEGPWPNDFLDATYTIAIP